MLRYMVTGTDLSKVAMPEVKGGNVRPQKEVAHPKKGVSSSKRKLKFWLLLISNVIIYVLVYNLWRGWTGWRSNGVWDNLTVNRGILTGIIYNSENPCAIICGKVVHQGDTVNGYKVVKIYRTKVELQKNGKSLTKRVH